MSDGCLAMSFRCLRYPSHALAHFEGASYLHNSSLKPIYATPPSSILLHTDDSDKLSNSKKGSGLEPGSLSQPMLTGTTTVGIIGGTLVDSTLNFTKKLVQWSVKDGADSVPFVLCSDPVLNKEILSYESDSLPSIIRMQGVLGKLSNYGNGYKYGKRYCSNDGSSNEA